MLSIETLLAMQAISDLLISLTLFIALIVGQRWLRRVSEHLELNLPSELSAAQYTLKVEGFPTVRRQMCVQRLHRSLMREHGMHVDGEGKRCRDAQEDTIPALEIRKFFESWGEARAPALPACLPAALTCHVRPGAASVGMS